jgi:acetyltransferase
MEKHFLDPLFNPRRVALIAGAGVAADDTARRALETCTVAVDVVELVQAQLRLTDLPRADLVILRVNADEVTAAIDAAAVLGARAAVLPLPSATPAQAQAWRDAAQRHALRLLGPQTLGLRRPHLGLAAGPLGDPQAPPREGNLALVTQSGALGSAILDWSGESAVGFSAVVTLGARSDVDLVQVLDFLAHDPRTHSILLHLEGVNDARGFMSALRAAAGIKPVIVLKAGRRAAGRRAALTHSGALVGENSVFSAALRRAGAVRVRLVTQLFAAARCLAARYRPVGDRLAVITNGGGPGVLAADWAGESKIRIEPIGAAAREALRGALAPEAVLDNPVDLGEEATPAHYAAAIGALQASPEVDGILVLFSPKAGVDSAAVCAAVIEASHGVTKPLIACWLGERGARAQRRALEDAGIPTFRTPEPAVDSFANIAQFHRNQQLLQQTPASISGARAPDVESARLVIESVLAERRQVLTEMESKALLSAFHIPVTRTMVARTPVEAVLIAAQAGYPVAMKVSSADIPHKSDVGGVALNVRSANDVRSRWTEIMQAVKEAQPDAQVKGIAIQKMAAKPTGRELHVGVAHDPLFGPVISFGAGGTMVELIRDRAIEFPPLNQFLARRLIERTRVAAMLEVFRGMPAVDMAALEDLLIRVSEMVCELPWLKEMDINPVLADAQGVVALDARIVIDHAPPGTGRHAHMAIRPYPTHLAEEVPLPDGASYLIRPVRPEDAQALQKLVQELSEESRYFRFISYARELSPRQLARYAQIDYHREMALVAEAGERIVGVSRYMLNPDGRSGEFALVVADDWHGRGLGARLMNALIETAREQGLERLEGYVLGDNQRMLQLMSRLGFDYRRDPEDATLRIVEKRL